MMSKIKNLKPQEKLLLLFAFINIMVILFGIYALMYNAVMGFGRDIMFVLGVIFPAVFLFLSTIIFIRKIHLKPKSSSANAAGYMIVLPLCVLLWSGALSSSANLVFDELFVREPMQTTADGRLDYSLSIYNLWERHQRVELFVRDNNVNISQTLILEIPFTIAGASGGRPPYDHRIDINPHGSYGNIYVITTQHRMNHREAAVFLFDADTWEIRDYK